MRCALFTIAVAAIGGCSNPAVDDGNPAGSPRIGLERVCAEPATFAAVRQSIVANWAPAGVGMDEARLEFGALLRKKLRFRKAVAERIDDRTKTTECSAQLEVALPSALAAILAQEDTLGAKVTDRGLAVQAGFKVQSTVNGDVELVTLVRPREVARFAYLAVYADRTLGPAASSEDRGSSEDVGSTQIIGENSVEAFADLGIDAPELPGHCRRGRQCVEGDPVASRAALAAAIVRGPATIAWRGRDRYGRTLARVRVAGVDLSDHRVRIRAAVQVARWE